MQYYTPESLAECGICNSYNGLQLRHGVACGQQHDIHSPSAPGFAFTIDDGRIGHGLAFSRPVEGERIGEGARVSEPRDTVVTGSFTLYHAGRRDADSRVVERHVRRLS